MTRILLLAMTAAVAAQAQVGSVEHDQVLFEGIHSGGYGGPRVAYGRVAGHDAVYLGGEGGWIVNHQFILGGALQGLITNQHAPGDLAQTHDLTMLYGGALLGYTLMPQRLVHVTFTALVGVGGLGKKVRGTDSETDLGDSYFVVEPAATADINVSKGFRLGLSASWRIVRGVETPGLSNSDLGGPFATMVLKFGSF